MVDMDKGILVIERRLAKIYFKWKERETLMETGGLVSQLSLAGLERK